MNKALTDRIEANKKEYHRLLKDSNYTKVRFNPQNGALSAIHKEHLFDPTIGKFGIPRGDYERISLNVLYEYGNSVVLESEILEEGIKTPDGLFNDVLFDIKGIEGNSHRVIKEAISKSSKQGVEIVVLYFHDEQMFDIDFVRASYDKYLINSKSKRVKKIYCIAGKRLHKI